MANHPKMNRFKLFGDNQLNVIISGCRNGENFRESLFVERAKLGYILDTTLREYDVVAFDNEHRTVYSGFGRLD